MCAAQTQELQTDDVVVSVAAASYAIELRLGFSARGYILLSHWHVHSYCVPVL